VKGKLRSDRSRFEKVTEGYIPKAGEPAMKHVRKATIHVKMKRGVYGITVKIVPPEAEFPDKVEVEAEEAEAEAEGEERVEEAEEGGEE